MSTETLILDQTQVDQKIKRIAFEIYENNFKEKQVILAGIQDKGYQLAQLLGEALSSIATFEVKVVEIILDKSAPTQSEIKLGCEDRELVNKCIVLIDDVLNTGRTLAYSLKPFLNIRVKKLETAVLVNRSHTRFPISAQYVGYQLSTTINEHVDVQLKSDAKAVYLS
ncbi:phosphoribosyltransferase [Fulvivirga sp. RKSG066]|uniref:phosphoribosyltransferase family protein n=1 Tax=Fulvivirga aurantia TaxID=2529383 RepID=UPI0012BBF2A4|nr:phosphoribosyltransferase family protein [Fulvivirga aurantia]MTI21152.1 phosphoribosyltransferase [Fulvivirga aurantia]